MAWEMISPGFRFGILMMNVNMGSHPFDCLLNECKLDFEIDALLLIKHYMHKIKPFFGCIFTHLMYKLFRKKCSFM